MDIALGSLRARHTPMLKVEGLYWILDQNVRPAIVVGYATNDPEKMSSIHHIIKVHVRQLPIFNVVSTMEDYSVKHTRVATPNVVLFDEKIPATTIIEARGYLAGQYTSYVLDVAKAFRDRGFEVPFVAQFEVDIQKPKRKSKVVKTKAKAKLSKRLRYIIEEDDEDGPVRCLTPIGKQVSFPERANSIIGEVGRSPKFTYKDSADGLTLVLDADTPINSIEVNSIEVDSVEDCHGLSTPVSIENTSFDMQKDWSAACSTQSALFEPC
jgi:hypothetical protein